MRNSILSTLGALAITTILAGGCAPVPASTGEFPSDPSNPADPSTPQNPANPVNPAPITPQRYAGVYDSQTPIDFTQAGVLPGLTSPALKALTLSGSNPGKALLDFADAAGVLDVPGFIRGILGAIITAELNKVLSPTLQRDLDVIAGLARLTESGKLKTRLTVHTPLANNTVEVELEIVGASFDTTTLTGMAQHIEVTVPAVAGSMKTMLTATIAPRANAADADLTLSGGSVNIPLGALLMQAIGPLVLQPAFGVTTLDAALTKVMMQPCMQLGVAVNNAVTNTIGFGIGSQVGTAICTTAVHLAAIEITTQLSTLHLDGVTITNGRATLYDISTTKPTADHQSDRIGDGTWSWNFGSIAVPTTLVGERTGTAQ